MILNGILSPGKKLVMRSILCAAIMVASLEMSAQSLPDFSGVWMQDITRSDDFYKNFDIKCTIIQTAQSFTVATTFYDKSGTELVTRESAFSLDGKEITDSEGTRRSAKWSQDKRTLVTTETKDYGGDVVGVTVSYSFSGDGVELTVITSDIKPDVKTVKQVFTRKV